MKKNKILLVLILLIGIFTFNYNVKADRVVGYDYGKIKLNIYNDETEQFDTQELSTMYATAGSVVFTTDEYGLNGLKEGKEVYIIDEKIILDVPTKEGYYFSGWYLDKDYKTSFLTSKVEEPTETEFELYGKWVKENPNNKTYIYGKDFSLVTFMSCGFYSCNTRIAEYIYNIVGKYLVNSKEKISELPSPSFFEIDAKFDGWYLKQEYVNSNCVKFDEKVNSINDLVTTNNKGNIIVKAKWESDNGEKECETTISDPTATSEPTPTDNSSTIIDNNNDDVETTTGNTKDNTMLYIGIASCGLGLLLVIIVIIINNKKNKNKVNTNTIENNNYINESNDTNNNE